MDVTVVTIFKTVCQNHLCVIILNMEIYQVYFNQDEMMAYISLKGFKRFPKYTDDSLMPLLKIITTQWEGPYLFDIKTTSKYI